MSVNLLDVTRAAQGRAVALTAETAGYLVLAVIDAGGLRQCTSLSEMVLLDSGEIRLGAALMSDHPGAPELALRGLLGQFLSLCSVAHPSLGEVSRAARQGTLARELEAALIPVNRSAGRRTLARACRDTARAKRAGKLSDLPVLDVQPQMPTAVAPVQAASSAAPAVSPAVVSAAKVERRRQPRSVTATTNQASDRKAPRIVEAPAKIEPQFTSVEHTVRIDQLRSSTAAVAESAARRARSVAVTDRRHEPRVTGRRLNDVRAALEQQGKTPFLGSVITEMRAQPLEHDTQIDPEVLPVEPVALPGPVLVSAPEPARVEPPQPFLANPTPPPPPFVANVSPVSTIETAVALSHTPPWQPNVAPLIQTVVRVEVPVAALEGPVVEPELASLVAQSEEASVEASDCEMPDASALVASESNSCGDAADAEQNVDATPEPWIASESEASPLEEAEGFFLLLDEAGSSKPPTVAAMEHTELVEIAQPSEPVEAFAADRITDEIFADNLKGDPDQSLDEALSSEPPSRKPLYEPRKTDLAALFADLDPPSAEQDVAYQLKLLAGVEASASSQTPPPVGFSEVSELSPPPQEATEGKSRTSQVLARAKGVGLATLTGLGVAFLLLRAPQPEPGARSLASGAPARCTASVQVMDAPSDAEIRVRAPAPNSRFAPLAAHGATALFPQLPCGTALEVLIRDSANADASWVIIPIAPEELTSRTEQVPLRISAQPEERTVDRTAQ